MYTYLAIERTPGFLKTEIVVQILVREVAAFKRDIIAAILQTIAQCQVMGELVGYHEILVLATDGLRIVGEAVHVLVFERFEKLNEYVQGTGLGLSICKLTVEKWGGEIWIDPAYTDGARFMFTHPMNL